MPFSKAIVRIPCRNFVNGITTSAHLGKPDYKSALKQHENYVNALKSCGLEVHILDADENYPDSVFVEDTAVLTSRCAVITNPGAFSRKGETKTMALCVEKFYGNTERINPPGTIEAGDVMMVEDHFFIGISERTNENGADQLTAILEKYGFTASKIILSRGMLHLKTGVSYIGDDTLLIVPALTSERQFERYKKIIIEDDEAYAANSIRLNEKVLIPFGYPKTKRKVEEAGFDIIQSDVSEFRKIDGGLSCMSLRF